MIDNKAQTALKLFGDRSTAIDPLRESTDNSVFVVGGGSDKKILRISKRLPLEDITFECEAVNYLAENGVTVPRFSVTASGAYYVVVDGDVAVLFDFMPGHHIQVDKDHLPDSSQAFEAGKGLAQIHNAGEKFQPSSSRRRTVFSELERTLPLESVFEEHFEGGIDFIKQIKSALEFGKTNQGMCGLIHNDFRPSNVFFDESDRLAGIIDFDWSCVGPIAKDVALGALEWSFPDGAAVPDFTIFDAFLAGYNSLARQKQVRDQKLYEWISFAALSDAATYFCDRVEDPNARKKISSSYMYKKFEFFAKLKI